MVLRTWDNGKRYFGCLRYPSCRGMHIAHFTGRPVGTPGDYETRKLRKLVHSLASKLWDYKNQEQRKKMYTWLKRNTRTGHIGSLNKEELINLYKKIIKLIDEKNKWKTQKINSKGRND
jgi:ssDNA-binding Zn-finger/Zn-ribbon topoisomerase 1